MSKTITEININMHLKNKVEYIEMVKTGEGKAVKFAGQCNL